MYSKNEILAKFLENFPKKLWKSKPISHRETSLLQHIKQQQNQILRSLGVIQVFILDPQFFLENFLRIQQGFHFCYTIFLPMQIALSLARLLIYTLHQTLALNFSQPNFCKNIFKKFESIFNTFYSFILPIAFPCIFFVKK